MRDLLKPICWWLSKKPTLNPTSTENIDQALQELRDLNKRQSEVLNSVKQPDILRSLVISMNSGRNR